jgi:hypothetical protein
MAQVKKKKKSRSWAWGMAQVVEHLLSSHETLESIPNAVKNKAKNKNTGRHWWLTPVIQATEEAEIRRIEVQSQPGQVVQETLSRKYPSEKGLTEWFKVKTPSSNPSTTKKKKRKNTKEQIYI